MNLLKNKTYLITLLSIVAQLLLVGCKNNQNETSNKNEGFKLEYIDRNLYSYSIGLNEKRTIRTSPLKLAYLEELEKNHFDLSFKDKIDSLIFYDESNNELNDCLNISFGSQNDDYWEKYPLIIECIKPFANSINIKKMIISFASKNIIEFHTNISLIYNDDYDNYPKFNPSYEIIQDVWETSYREDPWRYLNCFEKYCFFDLTRFYNPKNDQVILNNISFSDNLTKYLKDDLKVTFVNKNDHFGIVTLGKLNNHEYEFETSNFPYDMSNIINEARPIVFKTEIKDTCNIDNYVGGDIIYDVTINGNNYNIKDMFLFGPNFY